MDGFKEGISQFLHSGRRLRTDAILPLVEKLDDLKTTLSTLDTYRFYTSSLLLSYEGLDPELHGDAEEQQMVISEEDEEEKDVGGDRISRVKIPVSKSADFQYPNRGHSLDVDGNGKIISGPGAQPTQSTSFSADNISRLAAGEQPNNGFNKSNFGTTGGGGTSSVMPEGSN